MKIIQINSDNLKQYIKTPTLYFHDSHVKSFEYANNTLKIVFEKFDKTIVSVIYNMMNESGNATPEKLELEIQARLT